MQTTIIQSRMSGGEDLAESTSGRASTFSPVVVCLVVVNTAVFVALPIAFRGRFPYRLESLGTAWGPLVFGGQWWRLLTCSFVHFAFFHLFFNMVGLWILGTRMEQQLGKWVFLLFYLSCGLLVALSVLSLRPETASYGASGSVVGLAGGILVVYGSHFKSLSWGVRAKLGVVLLYSVGLVWRELSRGDLYLPHTVGLSAGLTLGSLLVFVVKTAQRRRWIFIGLALLMVIASVCIRGHHR